MVKYIVGAVIVVLSWVLAIVIRFPLWIPTLITLLVALVLILLVGIEKLRERRAARALEKALAAQAASQAASARPDLQHEIEQMRAEFEKAVTALKGSKKAGKKALYTLPWYTIIGPPGCGKSTALRNSGLQFPYLSASGGGVRGLGGTRNCDWWMTSDAVILDTAGRWTTEDEDHEEWLGFLDLVKRFRPRKPLNGIIAAVSIGDVGGAREDDVGELARRIRERIDEVQERLHMSLPVYVVFTKCDLIPGFVETFDYMSKEDRSQMWGFTVPLSKKIAGPKEHFTERFDELLRALSKRAPKRMGDERKVANRELIYGFPQQLEVLKSNLEEFVHQLFLPNVFRETPLMRGVYLTSGTQEGRPIDRVMSRMAEAFGQPLVQLPEPKVESKSYFLRDMFAEVVFKDAEVAARSPEELKRQRLRTMLAAAIIFSFALGISGLPTVAWALNQSYLDETRERVDAARGNLRGSTEGGELLHPTALEPLRLRTEELAGYADDGPPVMMQLGMYQDSVFGPVQAEYLHALEERVILPLLLGDAHSMDGFARRFEAMGEIPQASEMRTMYERLKLHILLTRPSEENEPALDDANREFIQRRLVARWAEATNVRRGDDEYAMIEDNVAYFVAQLGSHPDLYQDRDVSTVTRMRAVFAAVEGFEMAVQGIIDEVERRNVPDLLLGQLVGRSPHNLQAREVVRGAFTRRGWEEHVNHMLEEDASRFFGEHWVLGTVPPANEREAQIEHEAQLAGLRSYFLHRYVEEWQDFIDSIHVVQPQTPQAHLEEL
ncbi:MAG: type VI secretion system membrane subunit TssM, partial [Sandaracinaceae bacterium]